MAEEAGCEFIPRGAGDRARMPKPKVVPIAPGPIFRSAYRLPSKHPFAFPDPSRYN